MKKLILVALLSTLCFATYPHPCDFIPPPEWEAIESPQMTGSHKVLILEDTLDPTLEAGEKVFLYELGPHAEINVLSIHNSWEQVVIVTGHLIWLDQDKPLCTLEKGAYVDRPPYIEHGPFKAGPEGCLMIVRLHY